LPEHNSTRPHLFAVERRRIIDHQLHAPSVNSSILDAVFGWRSMLLGIISTSGLRNLR
jgi:hypothetical protein